MKDLTQIGDGTHQAKDGPAPDSGPAADLTPALDVQAPDQVVNEQGADQSAADVSVNEAGNPDVMVTEMGSVDQAGGDLTSFEAGADGAADAGLDLPAGDGSPDAAPLDQAGVDLLSPDVMAATCFNNTTDGDETDLDCGGSCPPCADDLSCQDGDDCQSGVCTNLVCIAPSCLDPVQNGDETGLNCGGSCPPCGDGLGCLNNADCVSGVCGGDLTCSAPACDDSVLNGNETALDCGGGTCAPCGDGLACLDGADCQSRNCDSTSHLCLAPTCVDQILNGDETDQDCGGNTCSPCSLGLDCALCTDCESTHCYDGQCVAPAATCAQILTDCPTAQDGTYFIDPTGGSSADRFAVSCDMTTDSGGWTEITRAIALNHLSGTMVGDEAVPDSGFGGANNDSPYAAGITGVSYHYSFQFLGGYSQFFLKDYQIQAASTGSDTSEIRPNDFFQTIWTKANGCPGSAVGDVSFGSSYLAGPTTSFARKLSSNVGCTNCVTDWPGGAEIYAIGSSSTSFRIGWGECGGQYEGWYPWYSGTIMLR